jgi:hypothetical protein
VPRAENVTPTCKSPHAAYFGGPVVSNPVVVPVFWNSDVNPDVVQYMPQFLSDVTNSTFWGAVAEYGTVGVSPAGGVGGSDQVIGSGSATQGITIVPSKCPASTDTRSCDLTDDQLQEELVTQMNDGILPLVTLDAQGNPNTIYMVFFPPKVVLTGPEGSGTSCVDFCAYHGTGTYGSGNTPLVYGAIMDEFTGACSTGCGENNTALENETDTTSHELVEAATDADVGLLPDSAPAIAFPVAWYAPNDNCGEVMDICDNFGAGDTITVDGRTWVVQEMWSNWQNQCTSVESLAYAFSAPTAATAGTPVTFTVNSPGTHYGGTITFTSTDPLADLPANSQFSGSETSFQVTFNTPGSQTITANDENASLITGSSTYTVAASTTPAVLTSPTPGLGTKLGTTNVQFQWTTGTNVSEYQLNLSAIAPGASELFLYKGTATSATALTLPANNVPVYATLYSKINGVWYSNAYEYTESGTPTPAALTSPTPGATTILGISNVQFQWTTGKNVSEYQLNLSAIAAGASDLFLYKGTALTATAATLPANGVTVYATLYSKINGVWQTPNSYVYTESGTPTPAALTSPTPGLSTTLGTSAVTFQWNAGIDVSDYQLNLSAVAPGGSELYLYKGTALTATATSLPGNGAELYARLYSKINGAWQYNDYVYTEGGTPTPATLTSPTPGLSTILGTSGVTFQWTAGIAVTDYQLNLSAIAPGDSELYLYKGTALTATATTLPANGVTVYARLYSKINGTWQYNDYQYTEQ